jgi:RNA polymerase sigma-70 factor (ECF subfamily)
MHILAMVYCAAQPVSKREPRNTKSAVKDDLDRLRRLDPQAISAVHDRYFPKIYRYCTYRLGDPTLAEDIASEVFLKLLESLQGRNPPRQNLSGWLHSTASNLVNDHYRKSYRNPEVDLEEDMPSNAPDPASSAENREKMLAAREALGRLTPEQQHVLALRFGVGLSVSEASEIMGKQSNAVKALQFRALKALRRFLKELEP